jgi:hypothetical protein
LYRAKNLVETGVDHLLWIIAVWMGIGFPWWKGPGSWESNEYRLLPLTPYKKGPFCSSSGKKGSIF